MDTKNAQRIHRFCDCFCIFWQIHLEYHVALPQMNVNRFKIYNMNGSLYRLELDENQHVIAIFRQLQLGSEYFRDNCHCEMAEEVREVIYHAA